MFVKSNILSFVTYEYNNSHNNQQTTNATIYYQTQQKP